MSLDRCKQSKNAVSAKRASKRAIKEICQTINCMIRSRMEVGCFDTLYTFQTCAGITEGVVKKVASIYTERGFTTEYDEGDDFDSAYLLSLKWSNV